MALPSVLWHCWLGGRKGIRPVKNWVVRYWRGYLFGLRCIWFAYGPADATATPSSLASIKSRMHCKAWDFWRLHKRVRSANNQWIDLNDLYIVWHAIAQRVAFWGSCIPLLKFLVALIFKIAINFWMHLFSGIGTRSGSCEWQQSKTWSADFNGSAPYVRPRSWLLRLSDS